MGEKGLSKKERKEKTDTKENLLHVFFVLIVISLFKVQLFCSNTFDTQLCSSSGWTRGNMTSSDREEEKWFLFNLIG